MNRTARHIARIRALPRWARWPYAPLFFCLALADLHRTTYLPAALRIAMWSAWGDLRQPAQPLPDTCAEKDCLEVGVIECFYPPFDSEENPFAGIYCPEHAKQNGFCMGCGIFCGGIESFDFGRFPGYCDNCIWEFRENDEIDDEYEDESEWDLEDLQMEVEE